MLMNGDPEAISLYIHIPFCRRKCAYCHFYVIANDADRQDLLLEALLCEWQLLRHLCSGKRLVSLYFGGGTPILMGAAKIHRLIASITQDFNVDSSCEITVEANPEEISAPLIRDLASAGVNRLSIGVQTHEDALLHTLGRSHRGSSALGAVEVCASSGIDNISIDLMYDLPDQTLESWEATLQRTTVLPIKHLSLYNLTIEPHTAFHRQRRTLTPRLPSDETSAEMFNLACHYLKQAGFEHYEISAFAKPGFYARHNTGYWTDRPFLGLGPSAYSYWDGRRFRNVANFNKYCTSVNGGMPAVDFSETLPVEEHLRERLVVNLRLLKGVDLTLFPPLPDTIKKSLNKLTEEGLVLYSGNHVQLTERGLLFYDTVAVALI
jgi:oxygen-independent coproporphyrinogen-3 oxidase